MSLICPLLWVISSSVDRDPSRSQHYLNSGVSVYECIIQSLANSLKSTSSRTHWDPVSLQGASCFTLRSRSLSWQPLAFSSLKKIKQNKIKQNQWHNCTIAGAKRIRPLWWFQMLLIHSEINPPSPHIQSHLTPTTNYAIWSLKIK